MPRRTHVTADEDVAFEFGHGNILHRVIGRSDDRAILKAFGGVARQKSRQRTTGPGFRSPDDPMASPSTALRSDCLYTPSRRDPVRRRHSLTSLRGRNNRPHGRSWQSTTSHGYAVWLSPAVRNAARVARFERDYGEPVGRGVRPTTTLLKASRHLPARKLDRDRDPTHIRWVS